VGVAVLLMLLMLMLLLTGGLPPSLRLSRSRLHKQRQLSAQQ
jgi:hypothetical protein